MDELRIIGNFEGFLSRLKAEEKALGRDFGAVGLEPTKS